MEAFRGRQPPLLYTVRFFPMVSLDTTGPNIHGWDGALWKEEREKRSLFLYVCFCWVIYHSDGGRKAKGSRVQNSASHTGYLSHSTSLGSGQPLTVPRPSEAHKVNNYVVR